MNLLDQVVDGAAFALLPLLLLLGRSCFDLQGLLGVRIAGVVSGILMFAGFLAFPRYPFRRRQNIQL